MPYERVEPEEHHDDGGCCGKLHPNRRAIICVVCGRQNRLSGSTAFVRDTPRAVPLRQQRLLADCSADHDRTLSCRSHRKLEDRPPQAPARRLHPVSRRWSGGWRLSGAYVCKYDRYRLSRCRRSWPAGPGRNMVCNGLGGLGARTGCWHSPTVRTGTSCHQFRAV